MKVSVTEEDIKHGCQSDCLSCPVARAIQCLLHPEYQVHVSGRVADIHLGEYRIDKIPICTARLNLVVQQWISGFDDKRLGHPFDFEIEVPSHLLK